MGYDVGGASVMDYQALFQESIQQDTLQEKHLGVSFKTVRTLLESTEERRIHRLHVAPTFNAVLFSPNHLIGSYLFCFLSFSFIFFIRLEYDSRIKTAYGVKDLFTAAILIVGRTARDI